MERSRKLLLACTVICAHILCACNEQPHFERLRRKDIHCNLTEENNNHNNASDPAVPPVCKSGCKVGYAGSYCSLKCSLKCIKCDRDTKNCSGHCQDGYYGDYCTKPCYHCDKCNATGTCINNTELNNKNSKRNLTTQRKDFNDTRTASSANSVNLKAIIIPIVVIVIVIVIVIVLWRKKKFCFSQRQQSGLHEDEQTRMNDMSENQDERPKESTTCNNNETQTS
ncbi:uncharacterized protein LOC121392024 [Gigantopelta aegis]|uniref:uncharacterized protein LOC121392024 n=1 Tax=Gigantopelta aegis TaxID=1735272 RepID=UPI001B88ACD4|nr:uncharacterized protein LOC121392024 [Gigantopelta aegis]